MARGRSYEKCWDTPYGGRAAGRHIPKWFSNLAIAIVGTFFRLAFRYEVKGRENLFAAAERSGVVLVANHTSFLDTIFIYLACRPRIYPRFMGRDTLFDDNPAIVGWVLSHVGVFPVKRDSADRTAMKRAATMLKNGETVVILPEGSRRGKGSRTPEVHGGAALIARMGKAPIVPMTVRDAEHIKEKGRRLRFPKVTAEIGEPLHVGDFDFLPKAQRLEGCVWYALRECFALSERVRPQDVDMRSLFPDARDYAEAFRDHPIARHALGEAAGAEPAGSDGAPSPEGGAS